MSDMWAIVINAGSIIVLSISIGLVGRRLTIIERLAAAGPTTGETS